MQRSKIKVGGEYAMARYRDWAQRPGSVKKVQPLDIGAWRVTAHWQAEQDTTDPDLVPDPDQPGQSLSVPKRYRRRTQTEWNRGLGNLVLVREWRDAKNGEPGHWGDPFAVETRLITTTWEDAEDQMQKARDERAAQRRAVEAERSRLAEREGRINERLRDLGIVMTSRVERSRFNHDVDILTIRADVLDTLLGLAEAGHAAQRAEDETAQAERDAL